MILLATLVFQLRVVGVNRVQPLDRLTGTVSLIVCHETKLVVVEFWYLKRTMGNVRRVEHHHYPHNKIQATAM